jgi:hypothetical protein
MDIMVVEWCSSFIYQFLDPAIDSSVARKSEKMCTREEIIVKGLETMLGGWTITTGWPQNTSITTSVSGQPSQGFLMTWRITQSTIIMKSH